jgi:hypothetical protein
VEGEHVDAAHAAQTERVGGHDPVAERHAVAGRLLAKEVEHGVGNLAFGIDIADAP